MFSPDFIAENSTGRFFYDTSTAYVGHLEGESDSHIHGVISRDGVFEGKITTENEQYVIEKSDRHFPERQPFHSVIYRHSDVQMDAFRGSFCHSDELHRKVKRWQDEDTRTRDKLKSAHAQRRRYDMVWEAKDSGFRNQSYMDYMDVVWRYKGNAGPGSGWYTDNRKRRDTDPTKTTCTLYIQADHLFYQKFGNNEERVIEQLTQHVQGVNQIYSIVDFDADGKEDRISFIIKRVKVHTNPRDPGYKFWGNYGVETFLELFSEDNFDAYCLAYMFTYRDFEGGTLGLAWTGDLTNAGGVCERNGQFRGSLKSLNTGIVTVLNYGKDVPSSVSHVTLAHELGHNLGSQHDPETELCAPGDPYGNYIMYARATSGDKPNNNKFSICSQSAMAEIMAAKARGPNGCFIPVTSSICGNGVVEAGEECDCGWEDECTDRCCFPQVEFGGLGKPCTRRPGAICSPTEGPCCSERCTLIGVDAALTCREESDCQYSAYCNGSSPACPGSASKPDRLFCNKRTSVCYQGQCTRSVCVAYGLESCQCEPEVEGDFSDSVLCHVCCKLPGPYSMCKSSFQWNLEPFNVPDLMISAGSACYQYQGVCDESHTCREMNPASPLANLKSMFFSAEGLNNMKIWLSKHWYVAVAAALGLIVFMVVVIKLCTPKTTEVITVAKSTSTFPRESAYRLAATRHSGLHGDSSCLHKIPIPTDV